MLYIYTKGSAIISITGIFPLYCLICMLVLRENISSWEIISHERETLNISASSERFDALATALSIQKSNRILILIEDLVQKFISPIHYLCECVCVCVRLCVRHFLFRHIYAHIYETMKMDTKRFILLIQCGNMRSEECFRHIHTSSYREHFQSIVIILGYVCMVMVNPLDVTYFMAIHSIDTGDVTMNRWENSNRFFAHSMSMLMFMFMHHG